MLFEKVARDASGDAISNTPSNNKLDLVSLHQGDTRPLSKPGNDQAVTELSFKNPILQFPETESGSSDALTKAVASDAIALNFNTTELYSTRAASTEKVLPIGTDDIGKMSFTPTPESNDFVSPIAMDGIYWDPSRFKT